RPAEPGGSPDRAGPSARRTRSLLEDRLLSGDEGALFEIANKFDLRHRKADQRRDYPDEYLDWIFHWYLATIELTNQLLRRELE
ncbi:MAG: hypothetical protein HC863_01715, partial [Myxococcales bacterium]|nr:hypothetical protein [Myxococcales bacterium]